MSDADADGGSRSRPWRRRALLAAGVVVGVPAVLLGSLLLALQVDAVSDTVARRAAGWVSGSSLRVHLDGATGSWVGGLDLRGARVVSLSEGDTAWAVSVDSASLAWSLGPLLRRTLELQRVDAVGVSARVQPDHLPEGEPAERPWKVRVGRMEVELRSLAVGPAEEGGPWTLSEGRLRAGELAVGGEGAPRGVLDTLHASFRPAGRPEGWGQVAGAGVLGDGEARLAGIVLHSPESRVEARGTVPLTLQGTAPEGLALDVSFAPLHLADLAPFLPAGVSDTLRLRGDAELRTRGDTLRGTVRAEAGGAGRLALEGAVSGPRDRPSFQGELTLEALRTGAWGLPGPAGILSGSVRTDVAGPVPDSLRGRVEAELLLEEDGGGEARVEVTARSDSGGAWRGDWVAAGRGAQGSGTAMLQPGEALRWEVDGRLGYRAPSEGALPGLAAFSGGVSAAGTGTSPDSATASVVLQVDSARTVSGARAGAGRLTASLERGEARVQAEVGLAGGRVDLEARGNVSARTGRLVRGRIEGVDVAALLGDTVSSSLRAEVEGELSAVEPLQARGTLQVLEASWGPWSLASGRVGARLEGDEALLRASGLLADSGSVGLRARLSLADGEVRSVRADSLAWSGLDLRTLAAAADSSRLPGTRLSGTGEARATRGAGGWTGSASLELDPSRVGRAQVEAGRARVGLGADTVEVELEAETTAAGSLSARARISRGEAGALELSDLRVQGLDLAALSDGVFPATELRGFATAGLAGTFPDSARGRLRLVLDSSWVAGRLVDTLSVTASVADGGGVETAGRVVAAGGTLAWEGEGELGARPTYRLDGRLERPAPSPGDSAAVDARWGLEGTGLQPDSARVEGWIEVDSARWAGRAVEDGRARVSLRDGVLRVDTVGIHLPGARLSAGGSLPLKAAPDGGGTLRLSGELSRADVLAGLVGPRVLAVGEAGVEATVEGSFEEMELRGDAWASALLLGEARMRGLELEARGRRTREEGWVQGRVHVVADRIRLPTAALQRLEAEVRMEPGDDLAFTASAVIDGRREAELSGRLEEVEETSAVRVERFSFRADEDRWSLAAPARVEVGPGLRVDSLALSAGGQAIRVRGHLAPSGPVDFHAAVDSFEISTVADLLGYPQLRGRVTGSLDLTGRGEAPVVEAALESRLEPRTAPPARVSLTASYRDARGEMESSVALDDGRALRAGATLPVGLELGRPFPGLLQGDSVRAYAQADSFPVRWFAAFLDPASIRDLQGTLQGRVDVRGRPDAPRMDGSLSLHEGGAGVPAAGVRFTGAGVRLAFQGTEVRVDSARVRSGGGTLSASGALTVERLEDPIWDLRLRAEGFRAMATSAVQATVSGDVQVQGPGGGPTIRGRVDVDRADLYLGELTSGSSAAPVDLTEEDWEELARVFGWERPSGEMTGPAFLETATLDLEVVLGRASWLRQRANPEMALQLTGDVSVQKEPGQDLRLVGMVETVAERSWVEQFGRRFAIEDGQLDFRGPVSETRVDVVARYDVPSRENPGQPEVSLTLSVTGTPENLSLDLSSTPTLQASDMVSYLVTGQPASQALGGAGEGGGLTGAGGALALGRLSTAVEAYAREQVGLDVVEITTDGLEGVTLLAGRFLSPRLYLGVRQPISIQRTSEDPGERAPTPELEVELQAARWLLLNLRAGGRQGAEFFVRSRLAYD